MEFVDSCDITICNTITETWNTFRVNEMYKQTKLIPITWTKTKHMNDPKNVVLNVNSRNEYINHIVSKLSKKYSDFVPIKCALIKIKGGDTLELEPVNIKYMKNSKILHIPITSNEDVVYQVDDQEKGVSPGIIYNFQIGSLYSIVNSGDTEYIYLLIELFDASSLDHEITYKYVTDINEFFV